MRKIPTLFQRIFENGKIVGITENVTSGMEWVLDGEGIATVKIDGSCCSIINGELYKRYDAKNGKPIPENAIKCQQEADPITGHLPCWLKCSADNPSDKWFLKAYENSCQTIPNYNFGEGTYEAIGKHFNANPYKYDLDVLIPHGDAVIENCPRTFESLRSFLEITPIEGIVFWKDGIPQCKIKRSDFGFKWPCENARTCL